MVILISAQQMIHVKKMKDIVYMTLNVKMGLHVEQTTAQHHLDLKILWTAAER